MQNGYTPPHHEYGYGHKARLENETVLPVQLLPRRATTGVQALMAAVLEDAVYVLMRNSLKHTANSRGSVVAAKEETLAWLRSDAEDHPFTFKTICLALDLDPQHTRQMLVRQMNAATQARRAAGKDYLHWVSSGKNRPGDKKRWYPSVRFEGDTEWTKLPFVYTGRDAYRAIKEYVAQRRREREAEREKMAAA